MNKKQQRQQKMLRQQEIVNAAKEAGRDLTAEEQTEFDSLQREIERLNGEIEAEEQQQRGMTPQSNAPPQNPANPEADTQRAIQEERAESAPSQNSAESSEWKPEATSRAVRHLTP